MNVEAFHKRLRELYLPPEKQFTLVDVPEIRFAAIDGKGNPESDESAEAVKWLYSAEECCAIITDKPYEDGRARFLEPTGLFP